jgi:hypothetical protein
MVGMAGVIIVNSQTRIKITVHDLFGLSTK